MKNNFILLITIFLMAVGCKKEKNTANNNGKNNTTNPPSKTYLVTKITERTNLDTTHYVKFEFTYDDKNRITQMTLPPDSYFGLGDTGPSLIYNYTYDSAGNLSTATYYQNTLYSATTSFTYSSDSIKVFFDNGVVTDNYAYTISKNRITSVNVDPRNHFSFDYDSIGNVTSYTQTDIGGIIGPRTYLTYDQKKNPFSMIGGNNPQIVYFLIFAVDFIDIVVYPGTTNGFSNINNLTSNPAGESEVSSFNGTTISYLYNSDGFPVFAAVESDTGSNNIFLTYTYLVK